MSRGDQEMSGCDAQTQPAEVDYKRDVINVAKIGFLLGVLVIVILMVFVINNFSLRQVEFAARALLGCCLLAVSVYKNPRKKSEDYYFVDKENWGWLRVLYGLSFFVLGSYATLEVVKIFTLWS